MRGLSYTVFKSKWQIVNLCSSKTTISKTFKFSVNVCNTWPFCHAKTQILILNSLGLVKHTENTQFLRLNLFFLLFWEDLCLSIYRCQKNWARTLGLVSNDRKFFQRLHIYQKNWKKLEIFWGYNSFLIIIAEIQTVNYLKIIQIFINTIE